jgi:hypothetical protein
MIIPVAAADRIYTGLELQPIQMGVTILRNERSHTVV